MSIKSRLLEFLKAEGISKSEFSRRMGLSPAYIGSMRKSMPEEKVEKLISIFPQLNRDWLLYGDGSMYRDEDEIGRDPHRLDKYVVPLLPVEAYAGRFPMIAEGVMPEDCKMIVAPVTGCHCAIRVTGDSMEPDIKNGTLLFIKKINDKAFIPWGHPLVLDTENGSLVKMLYPSDKGKDYFEAVSSNEKYPPFDVPIDSVYGIYRILAQVRETPYF